MANVEPTTGLLPSVVRCLNNELCLTCHRKRFFSIQLSSPGTKDYQVELFPLHSPLLGEFWLVSYPPLNNMFKFSGSPCLTWAQKRGTTSLCRKTTQQLLVRCLTTTRALSANAWCMKVWLMSLKQTYSNENVRVPFAFKNLMIHLILQFTLRIAFCCALHRCENLGIHRWWVLLWL